jgi:hypothetical protein
MLYSGNITYSFCSTDHWFIGIFSSCYCIVLSVCFLLLGVLFSRASCSSYRIMEKFFTMLSIAEEWSTSILGERGMKMVVVLLSHFIRVVMVPSYIVLPL